jgi:hypothetical protein
MTFMIDHCKKHGLKDRGTVNESRRVSASHELGRDREPAEHFVVVMLHNSSIP